jgi:hypothetical protein
LVLKRLRDSAAAQALGYRSFEELCKKAIAMSGSAASRLVRIVEKLPPELARELGLSKSLTVLQLCEATPEDDTPEDIVRDGVRLPSGDVLDVGRSTVREQKEAATKIREAGDKTGGDTARGGLKTSAEDRRVAAEAEAALHAAGLKRARVRAVARPGKVGDLKIEGIPTSGMGRLCKALCARQGK